MSEPALRRPAPPGPSDTDPVAHSTGVVSESEHESLRADIRRLSTMLGQTLARHNGPELLELVEEVRRLSRQAPESGGAEITNLLSGLDTGTAVALSRAFSQYFQLANTAEQLHRSRELRTLRPAEHRPLRDLMQRLAEEFPGEARGRRCRPRWSVWSCGRSSPRTRPSRRASRCCGYCAGSARPWTAGRTTTSSPRSSTSCGRPTRSAPASRWSPTRPAPSAGTSSSWPAPRCPSSSASSSARPGRPGSPSRTTHGRSCSGRGSAATATATRSSPRRSPARSSR